MRENESELQPASSDGDQESAGSWGTNGSAPAAGAEAQDAEIAAATEASDEIAAATEASDESAAAATAADPTAASATEDDPAAFLADLARVMQTAASAERIRIAEDSERRRTAHLELIRAREASETEQLTLLADGDVKAIDTWADAEIERIQSERERRITARRGELSQRLEDHRLLIGREVDAVEAAIAAYRTEVEVYFSRLDAEQDPVAIAREAGRRPVFPVLGVTSLDEAPAGATTEPAAEAAGGSDDPLSAGDAGTAIGDPDSAGSGEPDPGVGSSDAAAESAETTVGPNPVAPRSSAALMSSWFRRGDDSRPDPDA
jgi:hypothetical protein